MAVDISWTFVLPAAASAFSGAWLGQPSFRMPWQEARREASKVVDAYLPLPKLTCCSFQAGPDVRIDGQSFLGGFVDEPFMGFNWLSALRRLYEGEGSVRTFIFEESSLTLRLEGELVVMQEGKRPPATAPLTELACRHVIAASRYASAVDAIIAVCKQRAPSASDDERVKLAEIERQLTRDLGEIDQLSAWVYTDDRARVADALVGRLLTLSCEGDVAALFATLLRAGARDPQPLLDALARLSARDPSSEAAVRWALSGDIDERGVDVAPDFDAICAAAARLAPALSAMRAEKVAGRPPPWCVDDEPLTVWFFDQMGVGADRAALRARWRELASSHPEDASRLESSLWVATGEPWLAGLLEARGVDPGGPAGDYLTQLLCDITA